MAHGFTVQGGLGAGGSVIPHDSSAHSVLVPDTELLFTAQFHRAGPDLVLTGRDGQHHLIPGYFSSEQHPALVAPNGAHLSPDTVDLLAGSATPGHYAQAQPTAPPDSIGKIEKVVGDVSVVRNGVTVALHVGDAVFKSDVVQTGASAACGISFPDGTVLNLVANTRMALNEYAYDANSNSNDALFTLVEGTFAFVAGKVAHSGDMKIATPVATMGIRGTTGVVEEQPAAPATITAQAGGHTYTFAVLPDIGTGITGMWDVYQTDANGNIVRDANGNPIVLVTVSQTGYVTYLTPQGLDQPPLVSTEPVTNSQYAFEQEMLHQLFLTLNPLNQPNGNNGSSTTPPPFELPNPIPQLFEDKPGPYTINIPGSGSGTTATINDTVLSTGLLTVVIWIAGGSGPWSAGPSWLGGAPPTSPQEVEILNPVKVTTDGADSAAGLVVAGGATLNIVSGTSFTIYDFIHGAGTVAINSSGSDPALFIHGEVTLVGGGTIKMLGPTGEDYILGAAGTGAVLINIDYTIEGTGTIGGGDGNLTFENYGTVNANNGLLTVNTGNQVYNDGLMEATADSLAGTAGTLQIKDSVANAGTVEACGSGAAVTLSGATFDNLFSVVAKNGGSITFTSVAITNEAISTSDPTGGTINANGGTVAFDGGSIANGNLLEATNGGTLQLENITVTNSSAATATVDATSTLDLASAAILGGTIENDGHVVVTDGASVLHGDSVTNTGTMTVEAGASLTLEGDTTLINEGSAALIKADGGTVSIELDTDTNVNSGTIQAVNGGEVDFYINVEGGSNQGLIEAGAGGTVHFFQTHNGGGGGGGAQGGNYGTMEAIDGGLLIFDGGLDNYDLVEAVNGGTVDLNNGIKNHAGTIESTGAGSQISISGGDQSENAGLMEATQGGSITYTGGLNNDGSIRANNDGTIEADNNGTITFDSVIITNDNDGKIEAISGGSIIFKASLEIVGGINNNGGMIEASDGGTITFDATLFESPFTGAENINGGIIEAGAGGTIIIDGSNIGNGLFNNGSLIEAVGAGAKVELAGATIVGGSLKTSGSGVIETVSGTSTLLEVSIADGSSIETGASTILDLSGNGSNVAAVIHGTVTFEGTGTVEMDSTSYSIRGGTANATLNNQTTIEGQGTIGTGDTALPGVLTLVNSGTIEALGGEFVINTGTRNSATTTNSGMLEANGANAVLLIDFTNMNDAGGTIAALNGSDAISATASVVELLDDVIVGGTLQTSNFGTIETITNNGAASTTVFDGVINQGYVLVNDNTTLVLRDTINNTGGKIALALTGKADLQIDGTVTLENGEVELNTPLDKITALAAGATIDNTADIHGQGQIGSGDGNLTLDNLVGGTIDATGILIINTGENIVQNCGLIEAIVNGGVLTIESAVDNAGTIKADGGGAIVTLSAGVANYGTIEAITGGIVGIEAYSGTIDNYGTMKADGGQLQLYDQVQSTNVTNHADGVIEALDHGVVSITVVGGASNLAGGLIEADGGDVTFLVPGGLTNAANATIEALDGGILSFTNVATTLDNAGTVSLDDGTLALEFNMTLDGGGVVTLSDDCRNAIDSFGVPVTFTNVDNTISGAGTIGDAYLTLHNEQYGVIDADDSNTLILNTGSNTIANEGLLEATKGATLDIRSVVSNDGGTIKADGGTVDLNASAGNNGTIEAVDGGTVDINSGLLVNSVMVEADGGTVNIDASIENHGGTIEAVGGGLVTIGENVSIDQNFGGILEATGAGSKVEFEGGTTVTIGTIETSDGGLIELQGGNTFLGVIIEDGSFIKNDCGASLTLQDTTTLDGTVTLEGGGVILLQPTNSHIVGGSGGGTLVNETTIEGGGTIGGSDLVLDNQSCGTIDADRLIIIETGATVTNAGTLEATGGGTLEIHDSVTNTGGTIAASDANSLVELLGVTITGGTLAGSGGGVIETPCGTSTLSGVTIDGGSILQTSDGTFIDLESTTTINGTVTFEGGGTFMLDNPPDMASIVAGSGGGTLDIAAGATLTGSGDIGNAGSMGATLLTLNNAGTIDADGDGAALDINTGNTVTNTGLLEATCGGSLEIDDTVNNYGATPGMIKASSGGSITVLGAAVDSGSMTAGVAGGTIEADACSSIEFDTVTTIGLGSSVAGGGGTLDAAGGTITINNGELDVGSATSGGAGTVEASCGGSVELNGVTVNNYGGGTIEASHGGSITLSNGTLNDGSGAACVAGGLVEATGCGSTITFQGSNTVDLGTTVAGGGGTAEATHSGAIIFDGSTVTDAGGTIEALHGGTITFETEGSLDESSATKGIAGGTVEASGNCSTITFDNFTVKLDSAVCGGGGIVKASNGGAIVFNGGTINCAASAPTSGGTIEALSCGTISFYGTNIYNQGSSIEADGIGAMILLAGATILGGTLETSASGIIETIADTGDTTLDGVTGASGTDVQVSHDTTLVLNDGTTFTDGTLSILCSATVDVENGSNGGGGATLDGVNVTDKGALDVGDAASGATLSLDDGTTIIGNGTGKLIINANNTLDVEHGGNDGSGGATLDGVNVTDNGALDIGDVNSGAILTLDDGTTITGNGIGTLTINANNTLDVEHGGNDGSGGATLDDVNVTDNGALDVGDLGSGAILTLNDGTTIAGNGTGTLAINANNTLDVEHGGNDGSGGATLDGVNVTDNGALDIGDVNSGAILTLNDGTTIAGNGTGTLTVNANNTLDVEHGGGSGPNYGATLDGVNVTDNGALDIGDVNSGAILTLDDGTTITGNGAGTLTINYGSTLDIEKGSNDGVNGATLDGVIVQDNGAIDIGDVATGAVLTLDDGTTITGGGTAALTINANNTLDVENGPNGGGATLDDVHVTDNGALDIGDVATGAILTLQDDATITGGGTGTLTINANNTVDVETGINGGATLDGVNVTDSGALDIGDVNSGAILTLDDGTTITGNGTGTLTINANNTLDVERGGDSGPNYGGATLDGINVTDNGAIVLGEFSNTVLMLDDGTTIGGGGAGTLTIYADSTLDVEQGTNDNPPFGAVLDGVNVADDGTIVVGEFSASGTTLTLDDGTTVSGTGSSTLIIEAGSTLDIERGGGAGADHGATLDDVKVTDNRAIVVGEFSASGATLTLDDGTAIKGDDIGTLTIYVNSTLDVENGGSGGGATLDGVLVTDNGALDIGDIVSGATLFLEDDATIGGSGTMTINAADTLNVDSGTSTINLGGTVDNAGTVEATGGGALEIQSVVCNTGTLTADGGTLDVVAAVGGTGSATIADDGVLEFQSCVSADQTVTFSDTTGKLEVGDAADFHASIVGLAAGDTIDLTNMVVTSHDWNGSTLTLNGGTAALNIASIPSGDAFYFSTDGASGTDIRLYAAPVLSAPHVSGTATNFVTIDDPSTIHSSANGINDSGTIVGSGALDANHETGWEYNGTFSLVGVAGAQDSDVNGINDSGEIAGFYSPERSTPRYGFIDNGGTYSQINVPPGTSTTANINDNGVVVGGSYLHTISGVTPVYTGFIDDNGTITYLNAPGTLNSNGYTYANGINDSGAVVGAYETSYGGQQHGFLYENGTYTTIDDPNAGSGGTFATGINNSGIIVGSYYDSSGLLHGFVDINGTFTTVDDPLGAKGTQINGINNAGQIVGDYFDSSNVEHGFVASLNGVSTAEDRALTLTSLSVSDAGSGSNPILVTLEAGHGTLTLSNASGLSVGGQGTDDLTLTGTASEIAAALAAGVIYAPTLGYAYADVLTLTANDQGHNATGTPLTTTQEIGVVIAPEISIANGGSYEVTGASADTIAFAGNTGTLTLDHPSSFTGEIAGSFAIGDIIDLAGLSTTDTASTGAGSFNSATDETTLTVKDSGGNVVETFVLAGDHSSSSWTVTSDSHGGIDIVDPPASGAKDAPATVTAAPGNDHVAASASQNETAHVANPVNEAGFGSDQPSAVTSDVHNGGGATPATNELAPATAVLALDSGQFTGALGEAFGGDHAAAGNSSEADAAALTSGLSGDFSQTLLSSLLNVLTDNTSATAGVAPNTPVLGAEHPTDLSIVDGAGAANGADTSPASPTIPTNEHVTAPAAAASPPPAASPTIASATFGASGNDNFAFHPNLGGDTTQNSGGATNELAHNNVQVAGPALASTALEFHQEFGFDAFHQDDTHLAATLDQLHQMTASSTLLH